MKRKFGGAARVTLLSVTVAAATACDGSKSTQPVETAHNHSSAALSANASTSSAGLAKKLHARTARFHSTKQASKAGYVGGSPCVSSPDGGMGFHWVNDALVDPVFDPMNPEAILYAPDANGKLKLIAVEYLVIDVGQPAPTFDGQPFDVGGSPIPVDHWSLHVWVHKDNPSGLFAPFNPDVSCSAAE